MDNNCLNIQSNLLLLEEYKKAIDDNFLVSKGDINGVITYVNEKLCLRSGYTKEDLIGKPHNIFRHHTTNGEIYNDMWLTILSKKSWKGILKSKTKSGELLICDTIIVPLLDLSGNIMEFIAIREDVTTFVLATEELEREKVRRLEQQQQILLKEKEEELFKYRERYHTSQQDDAFKKQIKIIKDELSHIKLYDMFIDSFYKPLDTLSGDVYGTIQISESESFLYIIDAMGKGLSASVTSIQSSSFINNIVEISIAKDDFSLQKTIESYMKFIKKQILDDELVGAIFVYINRDEEFLEYANFGMPPIVYETNIGEVVQVNSNNLPIMQFFSNIKIDKLDFNQIRKLLIYSDGLCEAKMENNRPYINRLLNDFKNSLTKNIFLKELKKSVAEFEDDTTIIYITKLCSKISATDSTVIKNSLEELTYTIDKVAQRCYKLNLDQKGIIQLEFVLNEIMLNALEHGNLGIDFDLKQDLITQDKYDEYIIEAIKLQENLDKNIKINYFEYEFEKEYLLIITVADCGDGFDVNKLLKTLNLSKNIKFHGRGIMMSETVVDGLFYNRKGNEATVIKMLQKR